MKLDTGRLKDDFKGSIDSELQKKSQEYYILAFLKYINEEKYKDLVLDDRPDLKGEKVSVEVTIAESEDNMQVNGEYVKFINGKDSNSRRESIRIINKQGYDVDESLGVKRLKGGGGINLDTHKKNLENAFIRKNNKAKDYYRKDTCLELAILKLDREPSEWMEKICNWMGCILSKNENHFEIVYLFYLNHSFAFGKKGELITHESISDDVNNKLHFLARKTAQGLIKLDDIEWN